MNWTPLERFSNSIAESLDDICNEVVDAKTITAGDAVEALVKELEGWHTYYQERADFYRAFKDELKQRIR